LQPAVKVPIGILFLAWGGTVAEAWTSAGSLETMPDFTSALTAIRSVDPAQYPRRLAEWYRASDPGSAAEPAWSDSQLDASAWKTMKLPTDWQPAGLTNFNGIM
jgi:sialate O-acetylesterase